MYVEYFLNPNRTLDSSVYRLKIGLFKSACNWGSAKGMSVRDEESWNLGLDYAYHRHLWKKWVVPVDWSAYRV